MNAGWGLWPRISWNLPDFTLKSGGFHPWNLVDFTQISPVKSTQIIKASVSAKTLQFDECRVGAMTKDFMKSTRFHPEIWQIWPVKSSGFHPDITCKNPPKIIKASVSAKTLQFDECRMGDFTLKSGGFHPWNLADFTQIWPVKSTQNYKSKCFSKNSSVWWMQCGGLHPRNPVDFTLKSGGFQPWNLVDFTQIFTCEIHPKL